MAMWAADLIRCWEAAAVSVKVLVADSFQQGIKWSVMAGSVH